MKTLLVAVALTVALAAPSSAPAHNPGWLIHKAECLIGIGCRDVPPRPGPQTPCNDSNRGAVERIWDPKLGAYVDWICTPDGWRRLRIVQAIQLPWTPPQYRKVIDWHRACRSVVCRKIAVAHYYPSRWILGK